MDRFVHSVSVNVAKQLMQCLFSERKRLYSVNCQPVVLQSHQERSRATGFTTVSLQISIVGQISIVSTLYLFHTVNIVYITVYILVYIVECVMLKALHYIITVLSIGVFIIL